MPDLGARGGDPHRAVHDRVPNQIALILASLGATTVPDAGQAMTPPALIVAGPTASGKSALALELAERLGGIIINADAMQMYRELRILTARPTPEDEARVPHALYGVRPAAELARRSWREAALVEMAAARAAGRLPILTGGSGLYYASLTEGHRGCPRPRFGGADGKARALLKEMARPHCMRASPSRIRRQLHACGRLTASASPGHGRCGAALAPGSPRGRRGTARPAPWRFRRYPARSAAGGAARSDRTAPFEAMLRHGALQEVQALLGLRLDPALPAMRAHGVPELAAHLRGEISLEEAARRVELVTGQYTKRQATWFRHHSLAEPAYTYMIHALFTDPAQFSERNHSRLLAFIETRG